MKTVKYSLSVYRPSVNYIIATDWVTGGWLKMLLNVQSKVPNLLGYTREPVTLDDILVGTFAIILIYL